MPFDFHFRAAQEHAAAGAKTALAGVRSAGRSAWARLVGAPWRLIGLSVAIVLAALIGAVLLFLIFADWNALRGPISRYASQASGREVRIEGDLDVHPWSMRPRVIVNGLRIGNPAWMESDADMARVGRAAVSVDLLQLLLLRISVEALELDRPEVSLYRNADGRSNWSSGRDEPLRLPPIRQFSLRDGRLALADEKRNVTLDAQFASEESGARGGFRLNGEGRINRQAFRVDLSGASLLNVRRDRPYAFRADVRAGGTRINAAGAIDRPFDLASYSATLRVSGADMAALYPLIGLVLPNTPPYHLTGRLRHERSRYAFSDISGRVGDTDLAGQFVVTSAGVRGRTLLEADLHSRAMDWDDLLTVFGGAPSTARGETASAGQRAIAADLRSEGRLLPDAPLDIERVRNMDARVSYRAAQVRSSNWPVRRFAVNLTLDNGLLTMDPVTIGMPNGEVTGQASINAREETPRTRVDLRMRGARVESVLPRLAQSVRGSLAARAQLSGVGDDVRAAAASANGIVSVVVPRGEIREALAELAGVNVTRGLGLLLTGDEGTTAVRCAAAQFEVRNGIMTARSIIIDTGPVLIDGEGRINLREERMDITLQGHPKEARLLRLAVPINVSGPLRDPEINVEPGEAAGQIGIAAALGSILAPLAAILPFIDAGLEDDADCAALLRDARR
ncbi:MAG: AsmA family protein [Hyphomonadaceae bacterium]